MGIHPQVLKKSAYLVFDHFKVHVTQSAKTVGADVKFLYLFIF